jgi:hypothetical protein
MPYLQYAFMCGTRSYEFSEITGIANLFSVLSKNENILIFY